MFYLLVYVVVVFFFFFKQKTAYEVRISDWSSDVCSSDLLPQAVRSATRGVPGATKRGGGGEPVSGLFRTPEGLHPMTITVKLSKLSLSPINVRSRSEELLEIPQLAADIEARGILQNLLVTPVKIGRASCRESVCQYV